MAKFDRKGNKRSRQSFRNQKKRLGYYLIVTDTEATEKVYFQGLYERLPNNIKGDQLVSELLRLIEVGASCFSHHCLSNARCT